jgi:hypothetical protein
MEDCWYLSSKTSSSSLRFCGAQGLQAEAVEDEDLSLGQALEGMGIGSVGSGLGQLVKQA